MEVPLPHLTTHELDGTLLTCYSGNHNGVWIEQRESYGNGAKKGRCDSAVLAVS